jgi:hypothetical protein
MGQKTSPAQCELLLWRRRSGIGRERAKPSLLEEQALCVKATKTSEKRGNATEFVLDRVVGLGSLDGVVVVEKEWFGGC